MDFLENLAHVIDLRDWRSNLRGYEAIFSQFGLKNTCTFRRGINAIYYFAFFFF